MDNFLIGLHNRLLDTAVGIVGIFNFKAKTSPVTELIECEAAEPILGIVFEHFAEFPDHNSLIVCAGNVTVGVELAHYHWLRNTAVDFLESVVGHFCKLIGILNGISLKRPVHRILECNIKGPAPMKRHIFIYRPDIRFLYRLRKFLFHYDLGFVRIFNTADTQNSRNVWSVLLQYFIEAAVEIRNSLITCLPCSLCKREPISGCLMVYSEKKPAERPEVIGNSNKVFIRNIRINSKSKSNVLSVTAHISHISERLVVGRSVKSSLIGKIIVIGIVPLERNISVLHNLRDPAGPFLVKRIIAVHQRNTSVRSAKLMKNIVLINIFSPFRAVA